MTLYRLTGWIVLNHKKEWNMTLKPWKVPDEILELAVVLQQRNHVPRLQDATIVVCFDDTKPFVKNNLNLGKVVKFSVLNKLWHKQECDFWIVVMQIF